MDPETLSEFNCLITRLDYSKPFYRVNKLWNILSLNANIWAFCIPGRINIRQKLCEMFNLAFYRHTILPDLVLLLIQYDFIMTSPKHSDLIVIQCYLHTTHCNLVVSLSQNSIIMWLGESESLTLWDARLRNLYNCDLSPIKSRFIILWHHNDIPMI